MNEEERELTLNEITANTIYDRMELKDGVLKNKLRSMVADILTEEIDNYRAVIRESIYGFESNIGINAVIEFVCERSLVCYEDLQSKTRKREIVEARQICHWMIKNKVCYNRLSLDAIGQMIGGRDHATVLHSVRTVNNLIETDKTFRESLMVMCNELGARTMWIEEKKELKVTGYMKNKNNEKVSIEETEQAEHTEA